MLKDSDQVCKLLASLMSSYAHNIGQSSNWVALRGTDSEFTELPMLLNSLENKLYFIQDTACRGNRTVTDVCESLQEGVTDLVDYAIKLMGLQPDQPAWETPVVELDAINESTKSIVASPDGLLLTATADTKGLVTWDTDTWERNEKLSDEFVYASAIAYSPDSKFLAIAYWDPASAEDFGDQGVIKVLDINSGACVSKITEAYSMTGTVCWSADGKHILSESASQDIDVWDVASGKRVNTLSGHYEAIAFIKCSPDGKLFVSGDLNDRICIWDAQTYDRLKVIEIGADDVFNASWSPDSKFLAISGYRGIIRILETETFHGVQSMSKHLWTVSDISYSPNGKFLVSGGADGTIRIWDTQTGDCLKTYAFGLGDVTVTQWLADGEHIVCGGQSPKVYIVKTNLS